MQRMNSFIRLLSCFSPPIPIWYRFTVTTFRLSPYSKPWPQRNVPISQKEKEKEKSRCPLYAVIVPGCATVRAFPHLSIEQRRTLEAYKNRLLYKE